MSREWRSFPTEQLPEPVRSWVREQARALAVDEATVALPKLGVLAGLIGNSRRLCLSPEFSVPSVVWTLVLAESGTRKTPAIRAASENLEAIDRELRAESALTLAAFEAALDQPHGAKAEPRGDSPRRPPQRQASIDDATSEALLYALADNPRGLTHATDELVGTLLGFNQYRANGKGNDAQRYLRMYDAASVSLERAKGGPGGTRLSLAIQRAALSIAGAAQPESFKRALGVDAWENGLLARFAVAMPPDPHPRWSDIGASPVPSKTSLAVVERALASLAMPDGRPIDLELSRGGAERWAAFYDRHRERIASATGARRAHFSKLEALCARLALEFHLVRAVAGDATVEHSERVDGAAIDAAATIVGWFADEAERVYELLHESQAKRDARKLAEWIGRRGGEASAGDLLASGPRPRPRNAAEAEATLRRLEAAGFGALAYLPTPPGGGRSALVFRLLWDTGGSTRSVGDSDEPSSASTSIDGSRSKASDPPALDQWSDAELARQIAALSPEQRERWTERAGIRGDGSCDQATADRLALADVLEPAGELEPGADGWPVCDAGLCDERTPRATSNA